MTASFFFDAQNLLYAMRGISEEDVPFPDFDPLALAKLVCDKHGWNQGQIYFYTGVPGEDHQFLSEKAEGESDEHYESRRAYSEKAKTASEYWKRRIGRLGRYMKVSTTKTSLQDRKAFCETCRQEKVFANLHERGIDVLIGVDIVLEAVTGTSDIVVLFSQDHDFTGAIVRAREYLKEKRRKVRFFCAFIETPRSKPIKCCTALPLSVEEFNSCRDEFNYFRKQQR